MYRLPNQFDASASRQDLAAAGGGSTSTTCSSCVVTLIGASALSAVVLGSLEPLDPNAPPPAVDPDMPIQPSAWPTRPAPAPTVVADTEPPAQPPAAPMSRTKRRLLGAFALPLAALSGGVMGAANPVFGLFVAVAVMVGIFATVHERSGRSVKLGILVGICLLLGMMVAAAVEMALWLSLMK